MMLCKVDLLRLLVGTNKRQANKNEVIPWLESMELF